MEHIQLEGRIKNYAESSKSCAQILGTTCLQQHLQRGHRSKQNDNLILLLSKGKQTPISSYPTSM